MNFCSDCKNKNCPEEMPDPNSMACKHFKGDKITNGDKIRQGGNIELLIYWQKPKCSICAFNGKRDCSQASCSDGIIEWLNSEVESE